MRGSSACGERCSEPSVEALLGRRALAVADGPVADYVAGATLLVTGAGGSVGEALCKRLARHRPRRLILVDQAEAPLVGVATDLAYGDSATQAVPVLADLRSRGRTLEIFDLYRPDVVFHAAAYKHVPLVEAHPVEAVANNVLATQHAVDAACDVGVERFVLFSTDKAVRPTNVLGRTKAVAEWLVAEAGAREAARYAVVRLANVLDSSGSVLPLFRRQAARGGPITVTDPRTTRYLMTAGEAAGLALAAGALADSRSVYWLDVGPPVRIADIAERVAAAAPHDVAVEFIGLRPGERLHEPGFAGDDPTAKTSIRGVHRSPLHLVDAEWLSGLVEALRDDVEQAATAAVVAALDALHPAPPRAADLAPTAASR